MESDRGNRCKSRRAVACFPNDDPESADRMRQFTGQGQVDQQIRQAIQFAWMTLPNDRKTVAEVERVVRPVFERALKDFREDAEFFGLAR
jgi:hypothetical protein